MPAVAWPLQRGAVFQPIAAPSRGDWLDTVHFPDSVRQYPLQGKGFYLITGTVVEDFGVWNVEVVRMEKAGLRKMD